MVMECRRRGDEGEGMLQFPSVNVKIMSIYQAYIRVNVEL